MQGESIVVNFLSFFSKGQISFQFHLNSSLLLKIGQFIAIIYLTPFFLLVNVMDRRQRFEKHDWLFSKTQSILKHYICPDSCNASCCKHHVIDFHRKEYEKILKNVDKESASILKSNAVKSELEGCYKAIKAADQCPLLINSKCRIYENRPEACRSFPFVIFQDDEIEFGLTLLLCPMSVNIIQDYAHWYKSVNSTMSDRLNTVYEQYKNIDKNDEFCIQMKEHNLDSFIEFLERR